MTPYQYTYQNPIRYIDPMGMAPDWHEDKNNKNILIKDEGDDANSLKEFVNKNYKDAKLTDKLAQKLYSTMENNEVNLDQLNEDTLNKNLFGYNYPRKYNGESDYSTPPKLMEVASYFHDKDYEKVGAAGASGLFLSRKAIAADQRFVERISLLNIIKKKEDKV